jgi:hypothetical protein
MRVRPLTNSDIPALKAMECGFPYPDPMGNLELVLVVADDEDRPVMAAAAKKLLEAYLWCGEFRRPLAKVAAMRLLQSEMERVLAERGYNGIEAFLPPQIAGKFGKRLERTLGWVRNWGSWHRRFGDGKG